MLERIGGECAGGVALFPEGSESTARKGSEYRALNDQELQQIVTELPRRPLMAGTEGVRLSLAGAQNKLPVVVHGGEIGLPLGDTPSTHILKPEPDDYPGLALNEWFCMTLGRAMGLNVALVEYRVIGGRPCLLVQRYDRKTDGSDPTRFARSREVGPYLGLVPKQDQSGATDKQLHITKAGDSYLRRLLVGSAQYILGPFGPACGLRSFGARLAARGGKNAKRRAIVAVARKLAVLLHKLWVSDVAYDPGRGLKPEELAVLQSKPA